MGFLQRIKDQYNHIFNPLEDRQNRLRIGGLVYGGGVEKTQEELRNLLGISLSIQFSLSLA